MTVGGEILYNFCRLVKCHKEKIIVLVAGIDELLQSFMRAIDPRFHASGNVKDYADTYRRISIAEILDVLLYLVLVDFKIALIETGYKSAVWIDNRYRN